MRHIFIKYPGGVEMRLPGEFTREEVSSVVHARALAKPRGFLQVQNLIVPWAWTSGVRSAASAP